jgi:hypothetical protein
MRVLPPSRSRCRQTPGSSSNSNHSSSRVQCWRVLQPLLQVVRFSPAGMTVLRQLHARPVGARLARDCPPPTAPPAAADAKLDARMARRVHLLVFFLLWLPLEVTTVLASVASMGFVGEQGRNPVFIAPPLARLWFGPFTMRPARRNVLACTALHRPACLPKI